MTFQIRQYDKYKELKIIMENFTFDSGFMTEQESINMAISLIEAAYDLLLDTKYAEQNDFLNSILENLESN